MALPTFKQLTADYSAKDANSRLSEVAKDLNAELPSGTTMVGMNGDTSARYKAMITDIKKRADHTGLHGFRHDMKLHGGDFAEEVLLFAVEQAVLLAELNTGVHDRLHALAGGDPADPGSENMLLQAENHAALSAVSASGKAARAMVEKMLSKDPPAPPAGQPSAIDLHFYSATTYNNLDKALWHTARARKAQRLIEAHKATRKGALKNCTDAATLAFLVQTYFHHYHKAKVYSSALMPLVEFINHWVIQWRAAWIGTGPDDAKAMRNMMEVYETISTLRTIHKTWDCTKDGGICYGPSDDPKKQSKPFKEMKFTDGTAKFTPVILKMDTIDEVKKFFVDGWGEAGTALSSAWNKAGSGFNSAWKNAQIFYDETIEPLFDDESIFAEKDARDTSSSARDKESVAEVENDTRLQFQRFAFWVMGNASKYDWKKDETFIKHKMRRMVAAEHDDEKHAVEPPYGKIFPGKGNEARYARMMYDVYGLVEAKDLTKNISNAWKKFWAPKKKAEVAITLLFVAGGIVASVFTAGLPVIALIGIAAAKKLTTKASLKGVKKLNSKLNKDALKKSGDLDPNVEMKLTATEARESAASLARHFVSSYKNYQRMVDMRALLAAEAIAEPKQKYSRFYFPGCTPAVSYAYAAHAFEHHFTKTMAKLTHLTAMAKVILSGLEEGDDFFGGAELGTMLKDMHDVVVENGVDWHAKNCDGIRDGKSRVQASSARPTYVSQNLPSPVCYATNPVNSRDMDDGSNVRPYAPSRGLFFMDYVKAKNVAVPPFDMLEHWVNSRDVTLAALKKNLKPVLDAEKAKVKLEGVSPADNAAVLQQLAPGAAKDAA